MKIKDYIDSLTDEQIRIIFLHLREIVEQLVAQGLLDLREPCQK